MNYYSIEFFKYNLKELVKLSKDPKMSKIIKRMSEYVKDREDNNKDAYSTKWLKKPNFLS